MKMYSLETIGFNQENEDTRQFSTVVNQLGETPTTTTKIGQKLVQCNQHLYA